MTTATACQLTVIADDKGLLNRLVSCLRRDGLAFNVTRLASAEKFLQHINCHCPDVCLLIESTNILAGHFLEHYRKCTHGVPFLIVTVDNPELTGSDATTGTGIEVFQQKDSAGLLRSLSQQVRLQSALKRSRRLEKQVRRLEQQQLLMLDNSAIATAFLSKGNHLYCNSHYAFLFGIDNPASLRGTSVLQLLPVKHQEKLQALLASNGSNGRSLVLKGLNENTQALILKCSPAVYLGNSCTQLTIETITGNVDHRREKTRRDEQDLLTRLENQPAFTERLDSAIGSALQEAIQSLLLIVRIDDFPHVRETLGKPSTNQLLNDISSFLKEAINKPFTASRLAENEFGLLLYNSSPDEGQALALYISSKLDTVLISDHESGVRIRASIGMAAINDQSLDGEDMIKRARVNTGIATTGSLDTMNNTIRKALATDRVTLLFQPLVTFETESMERYEVLLRLQDNDDTALLPEQFLAQANINNLAESIDRTVLERLLACPDLQAGTNRQLFFHISCNSLANLNLLTWLSGELARAKISAARLVCVIDENAYYSNTEVVLAFCKALDELEIAIMINHFGQTLDPLPALKKLKPAWVRLAKSLTQNILYSRPQQENTRKLIRAIQHQGAKAVVTGIEDMEMLPLLWSLGVDCIQGHSLQTPQPTMYFRFPQLEQVCLTPKRQ